MHEWTTLASLGLNFLWIGAVGFGGGFGMIPLMKSAVIAQHWLGLAAFDQAIAMGQITPGPVAISATFIGERVAGTWGALVATVAVFAPSLVIVVLLTYGYERLRAVPGTRNVLLATLAGVVGLIAAVTVELGRSLVTGPVAVAVVAVVLVAALRWKIPYWAIILGAGVLGSLALRPG
jgi:chromate transporter